jgi:ActR/RegA family two-component response regulator
VRLLAGPADAPAFAPGRLTSPLAGVERLHGALQVAGATVESRPFGPEDLHLLSALSTVLAAALDHALRHGEIQRNLEVLSLLLDLAPTGLAALPGDGGVALSNETARRWLGAAGPAAVAARLAPEVLGVDWRVEPSFHLRVEGKLIYGEARPGPVVDGRPPSTAFVLFDLTPQQALLVDGLQRELWRCRWLGLDLAFVLLDSRPLAGGLLQRLPDLRARLQPGEIVGPYDAHRIGLVLPGLSQGAALARLRSLMTVLPAAGLQAAVVAAEGATAAERVLGAALARMRAADDALRPALLLHDDYPAVNDMLALILQRQFAIVKSNHYEDAVAHLRSQPFDALVTEVDLREGGGGLELARLARRLQPGIRPIFTTVAHDVPAAVGDPLLAGHLVIRKPFDVARVGAEVINALAGSEVPRGSARS